MLGDERRLGYAELGDPDGPLVFWFHGSPGARRQIPPAGVGAEELGLRLVCVERPGVGDSTDHAYPRITDWPPTWLSWQTISVTSDSWWSGCRGGPYALACASELPTRVIAVGLLGSLVPTAGEDAIAGGIVALSQRLNPVLKICDVAQ